MKLFHWRSAQAGALLQSLSYSLRHLASRVRGLESVGFLSVSAITIVSIPGQGVGVVKAKIEGITPKIALFPSLGRELGL